MAGLIIMSDTCQDRRLPQFARGKESPYPRARLSALFGERAERHHVMSQSQNHVHTPIMHPVAPLPALPAGRQPKCRC